MKLYSTIDTNLDKVSIQSALDRLHQWCCDWQLYANVGKCHVLHIGTSNHHYRYFCNGCQINDACIVSDIGIEIDSSLI